ncbi:MAG: IS110 family transposase [Actinomycetota bacterium]
MIFVGDDWAEAHHDICVLDEQGKMLAKRRVPEGVEGIRQFHELVADHAVDPAEVIVGIEIDRGLFVQALVTAGYQIYAINPFAASRYRDRHAVSGAKSDPGDAKVLAELVRTDRQNHRLIAGDTELAEAVKILARGHQNLIWTRQRQMNSLRSTLREFYPAALEAFGEDLDAACALAVLKKAPTPSEGRNLSRARIATALRQAGRQRGVDAKAKQIWTSLRIPQLEAPGLISRAFGVNVSATVALLQELNRQVAAIETQLSSSFEVHPDAEILHSLAGLGQVLGARVLAEFGDDPARYANAKARKCYAGTAPITKASGTRKVVLARVARNRRLADASYQWAFCSLTVSAGARKLYDAQRAKGATHHQALRAVANRWVGILHGCLSHRCLYDETIAWGAEDQALQVPAA